jgi:predicted O-methyltransferase YrrM
METIMSTAREKIYGDLNPYDNFERLPLDDQGWSSTSPVFEEVIKELQPKIIVEVGTWKGASAIHMAKNCLKHYNDFHIICIDTFMGSVEHWTKAKDLIFQNNTNGRPNIYPQFLSNVLHNELQDYITPLPVDSINGSEILLHYEIMADLIYIDAGHDYNSVRMDFIHYARNLREGGYLLGDDWFHEPIKAAAYDTFGDDKVIEKSRDKFLWIK